MGRLDYEGEGRIRGDFQVSGLCNWMNERECHSLREKDHLGLGKRGVNSIN